MKLKLVEKLLNTKRRQTISAYRDFFKTRNGQIVLHDLMKSCGYTSSSVGADPYETAFNEGARSVVIRILQTVQATPESIAKHLEVIQQQVEETYEH